jgi:hypothetical protein
MKRRGFLGFLGGAAVAGPSMAKQAVASGLEAMQVGGGMDAMAKGSPWVAGQSLAENIGYEEPSPMDDDHWTQRQLREFLGMSDEEKKHRRSEQHVHALDPDLVANRSFSLSAKLRIQRDRDFARSMANQEHYLRREIVDAIKRWTKRNLA